MKTKVNKFIKLLMIGLAFTIVGTQVNSTSVSATRKANIHQVVKRKVKKTSSKHKANKKVMQAASFNSNNIIPNLSKDTPKISYFSQDIIKQYSLKGFVWQNPKCITYAYTNLNDQEQQMAECEIARINNFNLVHLQKTTNATNADIIITMTMASQEESLKDGDLLGVTSGATCYTMSAKGLYYYTQEYVHLVKDNISKYKYLNELVFKHAFLHEMGHALGLAHVPDTSDKSLIMYPLADPYIILGGSLTERNIDQQYINSLAVLYRN